MIAVVVAVPPADVELAADVLWSLGVLAIEERGAGATVELWTALGDDVESLAGDLSTRLGSWPWRFVDVDESVADTWREHARPTWIADDLVICPAWVELAAPAGARVLRIEPGATFGLGDHPTTVLSMRALRAALRPDATVLDVGCGSGVLAIGACVLGASRATAIDISPAAVPVTTANAVANGVADRVEVSTTVLADVHGAFDIVVANILAPTLIELARDLTRVLAASGVLIVSGVLASNHGHVEAALLPLRCVGRSELGGWAALTLVAPTA